MQRERSKTLAQSYKHRPRLSCRRKTYKNPRDLDFWRSKVDTQ